MLYRIVTWSTRFRPLVVVLAAGLVVGGLVTLDGVGRDFLPEFDETVVEVQTEAVGLSAAEVERFITTPLEQDLLNGVAFLDHIESASLPGLSSVVMTFEPGTELLDARQVVAERLTQAAGLPQVTGPPRMVQPLSSTSRVAMVSMRSDELTPIEVSVLARWVVEPRLLAVPGVAHVALWGFRDQQLQVLVDPEQLAANGVDLGQVVATTGNALEVSPLTFLEASSPGTGGFIDTVNQRLHVFHEQAISTVEDLERVTLEGPDGEPVFVDGRPLTLGEVTDVTIGHQQLVGDALCDDGSCLLLVIEKFPSADTPSVAAGIDAALRALEPGLGGIEIDSSVYEPAAYLDAAGRDQRQVLLIGLALLLLVVGLLQASWRAAVLVGVSSVAAMAAGVIVLFLGDATLNAITIAGLVLVLVLVVDDATRSSVDVLERARRPDAAPPGLAHLVVRGTLRTRSAALAAAVIALMYALPALVLDGDGERFLVPLAATYATALAVATLVGLVLVPALSLLVLSGTSAGLATPRFVGRASERIEGVVRGAVAAPRAALVTGSALLVVTLVALPLVRPVLRPSLEERDLLVQLEAEPGTSLTRMDEVTADLVDRLGDVAGVDSVAAHIGRATLGDRIVTVSSADVWVGVSDDAAYGATVDEVRAVAAATSDVTSDVTTYSGLRVQQVLGDDDDGFVVRVYGEDETTRTTMAEEVSRTVAGVAGVAATSIDLPEMQSTLEVEVDLEAAQRHGISPGEVRRRAAILLSGIVVGNLFEEQKVFDVVVWGTPDIRTSADAVEQLPIATPTGGVVALGEIADVRVEPNPAIVRHESVSTFVDVVVDVEGRSLRDVARDVDAAVAAVAFPLEHHAEVLGGDVSSTALRVAAVAGALGLVVLLLLQATTGSWRLATLGVLLLPTCLAGGLAVVLVSGRDLTIGGVAGLVGVLALAARAVVGVLRDHARSRQHGEADADRVASVSGIHAARLLVSAAGITALLLPMLVAGSTAGFEVLTPLAIVLIGGLVTTSVATVAVLPAAVLSWGLVTPPDDSTDDLFVIDDVALVGVEGG